jgi:hypothetical protein
MVQAFSSMFSGSCPVKPIQRGYPIPISCNTIAKLWYPEFISFSCYWVKPYLTSQIFPIYEDDPLSPPEGEAAQRVYPLDPLFANWLTL